MEDLDMEAESTENMDTATFPSVMELDEGTGEYYFESDPLFLRNDKDYQLLMKTLVKLLSQRVQVVKDMEQILRVKEQALKDPLGFVQAIQDGEDLKLPGPINIARAPDIDFEAKYNVKEIIESMKPKTRKKGTKLPVKMDTSAITVDVGESSQETEKNCFKNIFSLQSKSQTFNQPWNDEEQRQLEKLLIKYPDQPIASQRWRKIAEEMGSRTPLQVQSRVQKFFVYLRKQGLTVPGKNPSSLLTRKVRKKQNCAGYNKSSFGNAFDFNPTSWESYPNQEATSQEEESDVSDDDDIPLSQRNTPQYQNLMRMKKVKKERLKESSSGILAHLSFQCNGCSTSPIIGPRYHCMDCPILCSTNFCKNCIYLNSNKGQHKTSHFMRLINYCA